ncbi:hypothetical protein [Desulfogranum mediterraneum]|uniref:hypothetical protein n=1 Tax=Desulfogranum mediterraneum TaxID=160661 RepID=UPI0004010896|nr:hypothetical protein [Desulfogranum mediterraneum]
MNLWPAFWRSWRSRCCRCYHWPLLLLCSWLLWGCGAKIGPLEPLTLPEQSRAAALFQAYQERPKVVALDADVQLNWNFFAGRGMVEGILQLQQPSRLRLSVLDPLGRALLVAATDGSEVTVIDSRSGIAYLGSVDSESWQRYVPEVIAATELSYLLAGQLPPDGYALAEVGRIGVGGDGEVGEFWYRLRGVDRDQTLLVQLDSDQATIRRCLFLDMDQDDQEAAVELSYSDYATAGGGQGLWPGRIRLSGSAVGGTVELRLVQVFSVQPRDALARPPQIPPSYRLEPLP